MDSTIILKNSAIKGETPRPENLVPGEVAVNLADKALYLKVTAGDVQRINVLPEEFEGHTHKQYLETPINNEITLTEGSEETLFMKGSGEDWGTVFNEWTRFSHLFGERPYDVGHLSGWLYDEPNNVVKSTINSPSTIGLVSKDKFEDYIFDVVVDSNDSDADMIGLVLAYAVDDDGRAHTISILRSPGGIGHNAEAFGKGAQRYLYRLGVNISDHNATTPIPTHDILTTNNNLIWGDTGLVDATRVQTTDVSTQGTPVGSGGWSDWNGVRIRVERKGDQFIVKTSQLGSRTLVEAATVTFNLNDHPSMAIFKGPQSIGYTNHSQIGATYETLVRPIKTGTVIDIVNKTISIWNGSNWTDSTYVNNSELPLNPNTFYANEVYNRLYLTGNNLDLSRVSIAEVSGEFSSSDAVVFDATRTLTPGASLVLDTVNLGVNQTHNIYGANIQVWVKDEEPGSPNYNEYVLARMGLGGQVTVSIGGSVGNEVIKVRNLTTDVTLNTRIYVSLPVK